MAIQKVVYAVRVAVLMMVFAQPAWSEERQKSASSSQLVAQQVIADPVKITSISLNADGTGIEIGANAQVLNPITRTQGKVVTIDLPNAVLALPDGKEFRVENPAQGIANIAVTQVSSTLVQAIITGIDNSPNPQIVSTERGLTIAYPTTIAQEDSLPELEIVVTGTRRQEPLANVPRSVTVITREEIEKQLPLSPSLQDILSREVPGLGASTQSRNQFGQNLRGRDISVLLDGVPLITNTQARGLQSIAPSVIERIEIVRGPNATYGSQATGGTINIITRKPSDKKLAQQTEVGLSAAVGNRSLLRGDSFGNYIAHNVSGTEANYNYLISISRDSTGSFYDGDGDRIFNDRPLDQSVTLNVLAKVGINLDPKQRLQMTFNHYNSTQVGNEYINDPSVNAFPAGTRKARALKVGKIEFIDSIPPKDLNNLLNFTYTNDLLFGSKVQTQAYYRGNTQNFFPGDSRTGFFQNITFGQVEHQNWGSRLQIETPVFTGANLLWGVDYDTENNTVTQDIFDPVTFDQSGGRIFRKTSERVEVPRYNLSQLGLFGQLKWNVSDKLIVDAGLRHQRIGFNVGNYTTFPGNQDVNGGKLDFSDTLPNIGAIYKIDDKINVFANFSQGFSIPDFGNLLRRPPVGFLIEGDFKEVEAVKVDNYEIGVRGNWEQLQASVAGFYTTSRLGEDFLLDSRGFPIGISRSPQRIYGVEGTIDWKSGNGWQLGSTATWQEGENDNNLDGVFLPLNSSTISPLKLTAYVQHQTTPDWRNRLQLVYIGERNRSVDAGTDPIGIKSYITLDYIGGIKVGNGTLNIGVENLLDSQYFPVQFQRAGGFDNFEKFSGRGRSLTARYALDW